MAARVWAGWRVPYVFAVDRDAIGRQGSARIFEEPGGWHRFGGWSLDVPVPKPNLRFARRSRSTCCGPRHSGRDCRRTPGIPLSGYTGSSRGRSIRAAWLASLCCLANQRASRRRSLACRTETRTKNAAVCGRPENTRERSSSRDNENLQPAGVTGETGTRVPRNRR